MGMRWFLALAIGLVGCSGCARQELSFSYTGSDDGFAQVQEAAKAWRESCGSEVSVERGGDGIPMTEVDAPNLGPGREGHAAEGITIRNGDDVKIMTFVRGPYVKETVMHELGHALGILDHAPHGIMAITANRTSEDVRVTAYECDQVTASR